MAISMSPASYWGIAIKVSLGKSKLSRVYKDFIDLALHNYGFTVLPIAPKHAAQLIGFTLRHKESFDRCF